MIARRILILIIATTLSVEIGASCMYGAGIDTQNADRSVFELTSCISAREYLSTDAEFLKAIAEDEQFADYIEHAGIPNSSQAVTVKPRNAAAVALMFDEEEAVWLYEGQCEEVPLKTDVKLKTVRGCSDLGKTFITFFGDIGILEIYPLRTD